jgi:magnesium transporter
MPPTSSPAGPEAVDRLLRDRDRTGFRQRLAQVGDRDLALAMKRLGARDLLAVFTALPDDRAERVFVLLAQPVRRELLEALPQDRAAALFGTLDPDDQATLGHQVPAPLAAVWLDALEPDERHLTERLLEHPPGSVGRVMSPEVVAVRADLTVGAALDLARQSAGTAETIYMLPVVDDTGVVLGVVSLRRLLSSDPATPVLDVMATPAVVFGTSEDQELAARAFAEAELIAAPVVGADGRLVGVLTVDDVMRILQEAGDEDLARGTATERLPRSYRVTSVFALTRARIGWLLVLILAATLTVTVLDHFQHLIDQVVVLALFVPLLIGTGGNAGAQSATTVVRALAVGDVHGSDHLRVFLKETGTGLVLGVLLAGVGFLPAAVFAGRSIAVVVCVALVAICVLATAVGSLTPMLARRLGIDPAVVSAPFISTIVDASGLIVYFLVASAVLGLD